MNTDEPMAEFVHTAGMDCPCGPERVPVGVMHIGQLDRVEVLVDDGNDENW